MEFRTQVNLAEYTSWLVGGPAEYFCQPETIDDLRAAVRFAESKKLKVTVLGGGSNVLISDAGIPGLVIQMRRFSGIEEQNRDGRICITVFSGSGKSELLRVFLKHKLAPALFLAGLPGDVGGGVVMNAGVAENFVPREFGEIVDWVEVLRTNNPDLPVERLSHDEIRWSYRHTEGWNPGIVTRVGLSWPNQPETDILERVKSANRTRLTKQPLLMPSCGSVFKNPEGAKAAQLIDSCGLKGFTIGGAQVSLKHANFIVNLGTATATELAQVIACVQATVKAQTGVSLVTEVIKLGEW